MNLGASLVRLYGIIPKQLVPIDFDGPFSGWCVACLFPRTRKRYTVALVFITIDVCECLLPDPAVNSLVLHELIHFHRKQGNQGGNQIQYFRHLHFRLDHAMVQSSFAKKKKNRRRIAQFRSCLCVTAGLPHWMPSGRFASSPL